MIGYLQDMDLFNMQSFDIFETTIPEKLQTGKQWMNPKNDKIGLINKFGDESAYRHPESNQSAIDLFWFGSKYYIFSCFMLEFV